MLTEIQSTNGPDIEHKFLYKKQTTTTKKEIHKTTWYAKKSFSWEKKAFPGSDS